jgi:hemolysin activation/secretion protein
LFHNQIKGKIVIWGELFFYKQLKGMNKLTRMNFLPVLLVALGLSVALSSAVFAQVAPGAVPGPADVGRIKPEEKLLEPNHSQDQQILVPQVLPSAPIPPGAKYISFTLKSVNIEGMTVFTQKQMEALYKGDIGTQPSITIVWDIAGAITKRYNNAGYFLSRAYVPEQKITDGVITIKVIEGYIGKVDAPDEVKSHRAVQKYIERLLAQRPSEIKNVESFLLRMNDLPGYSFRAVLSPIGNTDDNEGAVLLTLVPAAKEGKGTISFDNYSSRYLGPNEISASYSKSFLPLQQTTVTGLSSVPSDLRYGMVDHSVVIGPDLTLELNGGLTKAYPGFTLASSKIDSTATSGTLSLNYQWIRQRQENLALKFSFDSRDVVSDILDTPLTRDHIRALRYGATYDGSDNWQGYNTATTTFSQGVHVLGSSDENDPYLSRAGAKPDFSKLELSASRLQSFSNEWSLLTAVSGQDASGILYSSEEFGYGGQAFGRAYDASEITGDRGMSGSLEVRNGTWGALQPVSYQPYVFYDIGEVWNISATQPPRESGASAGVGVRFATIWHQSGNLGLAWPLTREITTPIYGSSVEGPRILLQVGQDF